MRIKQPRGEQDPSGGRRKSASEAEKHRPSDRELLDRLRVELAVLDRKVHDMKLYTQLRKWEELVRTFGDLEPLVGRVENAMDQTIGRFEAGEYMTAAQVQRIQQRMDVIERAEATRAKARLAGGKT